MTQMKKHLLLHNKVAKKEYLIPAIRKMKAEEVKKVFNQNFKMIQSKTEPKINYFVPKNNAIDYKDQDFKKISPLKPRKKAVPKKKEEPKKKKVAKTLKVVPAKKDEPKKVKLNILPGKKKIRTLRIVPAKK